MAKIRVAKQTGVEPGKPTPAQLALANKFAKDFAIRKGLTAIGENANVGGKIPNFVDERGNVLPAQTNLKLPPNTITDIRKIPTYVTDKDIQIGNDNIPYYIDQSSGDIQPIHPDIIRSSRFNPNRGQYGINLIAKK